MKKVLLAILVSLTCMYGNAVEFTCPEIKSNISKWNTINEQYQSDICKWAKVVIDSGMCKLNNDGGVELEYVIYCTDSFTLDKIKETTIDFLQNYFNIDNNTRANLVQGTTDNSLFFKGVLQKISSTPAIVYNSDIIFNFKFKANRLKINVQIPGVYCYLDGTKYNRNIAALSPLLDYKSSKKSKEQDSISFINVLANLYSYPSYYLKFLNEHYQKNVLDDDNW